MSQFLGFTAGLVCRIKQTMDIRIENAQLRKERDAERSTVPITDPRSPVDNLNDFPD